MWSAKKFIIAMVLAAVLVAAGIGGVVLAQESEEDAPAAKVGEFLESVCAIYEDNTGDAIDPEELREAIKQARGEARDAAIEARLDRLVEEGVIDEAQAEEFLEWWEARPEDLPFKPALGGHMMQRGFSGAGNFGPPPLPE